MKHFDENQAVGDLVVQQPSLSSVFQDMGIDFCCGGGKSLAQASKEAGLSLQSLLDALEKRKRETELEGKEAALPDSLTGLADEIEATHHVFLRDELPRLDAMTERVARAHGDKDWRLLEIRKTFVGAVNEIEPHMMKEEQVLFPAIRRLEAAQSGPVFNGASLAGPVNQMEVDHEGLGEALKAMRSLSDGYQPPEWACNTYRAMLDGLQRLEKDLHIHVHKENNVLFPRALEMEKEKNSAAEGPMAEVNPT